MDKNTDNNLLSFINKYGEHSIRLHYGLDFFDNIIWGIVVATFFLGMVLLAIPGGYFISLMLPGASFYIVRRIFKSLYVFLEEEVEKLERQNASQESEGVNVNP